ncbi:MAG: HPF/RaiA family ribosome-associated protein [Planctomycetota bacterium]
MQVHFLSRGVPDPDDLRAHLERRAAFSFDRFRNRIRSVRVRLRDDNGPRGGADKRCSLAIELVRGPRLFYEANDADPHAALDRVVDRATRGLVREIERARVFSDRIPAGGPVP